MSEHKTIPDEMRSLADMIDRGEVFETSINTRFCDAEFGTRQVIISVTYPTKGKFVRGKYQEATHDE